ncbi:MAG: PVC-type heme-binding CxxCH protein, partial [Planctomycetia bacterium]
MATAVAFIMAWVGVASVGPATAGEATPDTLRLPDDLTATLFAAEPLLSSPSDIDVDARGRVWVCEVLNYRGKKETRAEGDRILVLEDTDGDGRADRQTVFHQGRDIDSALGICVIGEGPGRKVIVSCAPDVFIFHDDDGDLKADRKESLFTKTGQPQHDHSVHAFVVGPDGRWYFNFGNTGKSVHDRDGNPVQDRFGNVVNDSGKPYRQGMVFRCKPDGSDFEVLGHNFRNNYEVAVDSFGTLWQSDNDDDGNKGVRINWVMEYGNYGYVDELTGAGWRAPRTNLEAEVPQQHWHLNDPGVVPNLLMTGGGSPCGICVYEGRLLRLLGEAVERERPGAE